MLPLLAVGTARLLATLRPSQLRRILEFARRGARPATAQQAHTARQAVVAVSLRCAGKGCLQRSLAAPSTAAPTAPDPPGAPEYAPTPSPPRLDPSRQPAHRRTPPPATTDPYSPSHPPHPEKPRADPFTPRYSAMSPDPSTMRRMDTLFGLSGSTHPAGLLAVLTAGLGVGNRGATSRTPGACLFEPC